MMTMMIMMMMMTVSFRCLIIATTLYDGNGVYGVYKVAKAVRLAPRAYILLSKLAWMELMKWIGVCAGRFSFLF